MIMNMGNFWERMSFEMNEKKHFRFYYFKTIKIGENSFVANILDHHYLIGKVNKN